MQGKNELFTALCHYPQDLSPSNISDIQMWAFKRRYGALTFGAASSGLYLLYTYLRHRPINKALAVAAGIAGFFYFHEIMWLDRFPDVREENPKLSAQKVLRFHQKVLHSNGYS